MSIKTTFLQAQKNRPKAATQNLYLTRDFARG